jgi:hypothetical protein
MPRHKSFKKRSYNKYWHQAYYYFYTVSGGMPQRLLPGRGARKKQRIA